MLFRSRLFMHWHLPCKRVISDRKHSKWLREDSKVLAGIQALFWEARRQKSGVRSQKPELPGHCSRLPFFHLSSRPTQLRRTHPMRLASQIDPRYVGSHHWQPLGFHIAVRFVGFPAILWHPAIHLSNTTAQVGRHSDSGLGESYRSLANVQLPSRSHAVFGAYAPMKKGL